MQSICILNGRLFCRASGALFPAGRPLSPEICGRMPFPAACPLMLPTGICLLMPSPAACPLMPFPGICSRMPSAVPAVQTGWTPCFSPACTCRAPPPRTPPHRNTRSPAHSPPNMHGYGRNISCCQQQAVSLHQQTHIPWHHRQHAGPGASFSCAEARRHYIHSSVHTSSSSNLR